MNYTLRTNPIVLLIDDDQTLHVWAARHLAKLGVTLLSCYNGKQGIDTFLEHSPDLILIDVEMPEMDGFNTCEAIRHLTNEKMPPIVMITIIEEPEKIAQAYAVGATDFVVKPINWEILLHRLQYMLKASSVLRKLEASERRLSKAKQMARLGDWEWLANDNSLHWSDEIFNMVELSREQLTPDTQNFKNFIHAADMPYVAKHIINAIKTKHSATLEFRIITARQHELIVSQQIEAQFNQQDQLIGLTGTVQDITERKNQENKIRSLAYFDEVTSLPNRTFFLEFLDKTIKLAIRNKTSFAILFLDLDGFKGINDSYGHQAGDELLREISNRLTSGLRCSDLTSRYYEHIDQKVDVARLGGDEFTILLNNLSQPEDAAIVAQRINDWIAQPITLGERQAHIGASIGITVFPHDAEDSGSLLKNADMAMYHAKRMGKGHYQFFQEAMAIRAKKRLEMESHMHYAIQRNELLLHYQPVIDAKSERLIGAEALLRWKSAELGFMPPNDFISFAEENGMIIQFGEWVIREAFRQYEYWQSLNLGELTVSINLSNLQFHQPSFIPMVASIIKNANVNPNFISFELTESTIMLDTENILNKLKKLKNIGVQLSIDDFGTGYSSLSYLNRFPLDSLKIDRSFVNNLPANKDSSAIVNAILALSKALNLKTIAEGVEMEEQKNFLRDAACDAIQGFYFSKPLAPTEFENYWRQKNHLST